MARQLELCLQPRVQRLLRPNPGSWRQRLRRWPFWFFVMVGLAPSVVFSVANLQFNKGQFIPASGPQHDFFENIQVPVVNGTAFPIAIFLVVRFAWPVLKAVGRIGTGKSVSGEELARCRRRALRVGDFAAWLGLALWLISGLVFPLWQYFQFGDDNRVGFLNFIASQIACGWISSTLTFFLLTFMFVRAFYPVLVRPDETHGEELIGLTRLERRCGICFVLTFTAPFFASGLLAISGLQTVWMFSLAVIGFVCSIVAYNMLQLIKADLVSLQVVMDPTRDVASVTSDTVESVWTGTR